MIKRLRSRRPRVLVCSSGGVGNVGDDAILMRSLERVASTCRPSQTDVLTDENHRLPALASGHRLGLMRDWETIELAGYALVVVAGGGFVCDWFGDHLAARVGIAERARAADVPVLMTGQGVGPLTEPARVAELRTLAKLADAFSVRDPASRDLLADLGIASTVTGDDALGLQGDGSAPPTADNYVVIHLRKAPYQTDDDESLAEWARATKAYADANGYDVIGVAVNNRSEAPEVATLRAAGIDRVIDTTHDPRLLVTVVTGATAVVGHSYHVAMLALAAGTPTLLSSAGDYYAGKAEGLRALAELTDALFASVPPTASELSDRICATGAALRGNDALAQAATRVDTFLRERWAAR